MPKPTTDDVNIGNNYTLMRTLTLAIGDSRFAKRSLVSWVGSQ